MISRMHAINVRKVCAGLCLLIASVHFELVAWTQEPNAAAEQKASEYVRTQLGVTNIRSYAIDGDEVELEILPYDGAAEANIEEEVEEFIDAVDRAKAKNLMPNVLLVGESFPPWDQERGTCVGHAVALAFAVELDRVSDKLDLIDYDESSMQQLLPNPYWAWDKQALHRIDLAEQNKKQKNKKDTPMQVGASSRSGLKVFEYHGCPTISSRRLPKSKFSNWITFSGKMAAETISSKERLERYQSRAKRCLIDAGKHRATGMVTLRSLVEIKEQLSQGHAVVLTIYPGYGFGRSKKRTLQDQRASWQKFHSLHDGKKKKPSTHSIACIGYDDEESCLILLNSWGTRHDNGRVKVSYNLFSPQNYEELEYQSADRETKFAIKAYSFRGAELVKRDPSHHENQLNEIHSVVKETTGKLCQFEIGSSNGLTNHQRYRLYTDYLTDKKVGGIRPKIFKSKNDTIVLKYTHDMFVRVDYVNEEGAVEDFELVFLDHPKTNIIR